MHKQVVRVAYAQLVLLQMLEDLCQERMLLRNSVVTLENTSFLFTGIKP